MTTGAAKMGPYGLWTLIAVLLLVFSIFGCAGQKSSQAIVEKEYQRILDRQSKKNVAEDNEAKKQVPENNDPTVLERLGDGYYRQGNIDMAFIEYTRALKINPHLYSVRLKLGFLMTKKKLWGDALAEFDTVLKHDRANGQALQGRAEVLLNLGRLDEAEKDASAAIALNPQAWQSYGLLGNIYDKAARYGDAERAYRMAVAINPKAAPLFDDLGVALCRAGKYRESLHEFLIALRLDPSRSQTYGNIGLALFKLGMYPEALESFRRSGDDGAAYNAMGLLYMKEKRYAEAIEAFEKAIDAKPTYYGSAQVSLERARAALRAQEVTSAQ